MLFLKIVVVELFLSEKEKKSRWDFNCWPPERSPYPLQFILWIFLSSVISEIKAFLKFQISKEILHAEWNLYHKVSLGE